MNECFEDQKTFYCILGQVFEYVVVHIIVYNDTPLMLLPFAGTQLSLGQTKLIKS